MERGEWAGGRPWPRGPFGVAGNNGSINSHCSSVSFIPHIKPSIPNLSRQILKLTHFDYGMTSSNYVSSDFGEVDANPITRKLSLAYAKVSVIHNSKENFMPVFEGSQVFTADEDDILTALGLDNIDEQSAIPAGLMKAGNGISVPIKYSGGFLIGPEGAHMNVSGISGLATKTSYIRVYGH